MYQIHPTNSNTEATITTTLSPPAPLGSGPTRHGRKLSHVQFGKRSHSGLDEYAFSVLTMPFDDKSKVPSLSSRLPSPVESNIQIEEDSEKGDTHSLSPVRKEGRAKRFLRWLFATSNMGPFTKGSHWPLFTYLMVAFTIITFSGELLLGKQSSGEFFELEPFNYMLGPSMEIMIQAGARFPPCMRHVDSMSSNQRYICLHTIQQSTSLTPSALLSSNRTLAQPSQSQSFVLLDPLIDLTNPQLINSTCTLANICGMTVFHQDKVPDQTFRLLTPLFVHTGIIHLCFNLMVLLLLGIRVERTVNSLRFSILFICSGVFGHALGANIAPATTPFLGFSSSLFGILGYLYVDLAINWTRLDQPVRYLWKLIVSTGATFLLGLMPGVDTFSHFGGLIGGVLLGIFLIPVKWWSHSDMTKTKVVLVHSLRILSICVYIVSFALLVHFFSIVKLGQVCTYCRYLSCLPINGFCD